MHRVMNWACFAEGFCRVARPRGVCVTVAGFANMLRTILTRTERGCLLFSRGPWPRPCDPAWPPSAKGLRPAYLLRLAWARRLRSTASKPEAHPTLPSKAKPARADQLTQAG